MFVVLCRYCQRNFNEDREGSKDVSTQEHPVTVVVRRPWVLHCFQKNILPLIVKIVIGQCKNEFHRARFPAVLEMVLLCLGRWAREELSDFGYIPCFLLQLFGNCHFLAVLLLLWNISPG